MPVQPSNTGEVQRFNIDGHKVASVPAETAIITERGELEEITKDWADLAERALIPSGAAEPAWLIPLFTHIGNSKGARIMTVRHNGRLTGLFPLARRTALLESNLATPLTFSGVPLIDRDRWRAVFIAFLEAVGRRSVLFQEVPSDGPFWDMLSDVADRLNLPVAVLNQWERAAFLPTTSFEEWFDSNFERKRRKEYRRLWARLAEKGELDFFSWEPGMELDPWISDLMALEAKGWKGRRGTALAQDPAMARAYGEGIKRLAADGELRFWMLALNGKPIAMMSGMLSGGQGWLGKIAYDEDYAKFSPGVHLILNVTEDLCNEVGLDIVDSCAIPNHPMIDNIWRDRIGLCDVMIAAPGHSTTAFQMTLAAVSTRRGLRSFGKKIVYGIMRRQPS
jgi:CelD/BcsL family acetyltransferase involved in cellulose biosynthesis